MGYLAEVDERVAPDARHLRVDLGYYDASAFDCGLGNTDFYAIAAEAMLVGWGDGDEGDVDGQVALGEEARDFVQEDGCKIGLAALDGASHVGADEEGVDVERRFHTGGSIGGGPCCEHMDYFYVVKVWSPVDQLMC
jgi:hypothetical protein